MKKGLIFTLEALIALVLLVTFSTTIALVVNSNNAPQHSQESLHTVAQDSVTVLSQLRLRDLRRDPVVSEMFSEGVLSNTQYDDTVMAVIGTLWASNDSANLSWAGNLTQSVLSSVVPATLNWAVAFDGSIIYNTTYPNPERSLAVSRRIVSGVNSSKPTTGCVARAFLHNIRGKNERAYAFLGGFAGQGNVTVSIRGVSQDATFKGITVEANAGDDFMLSVNGNECEVLHRSNPGDNYSVDSWAVTDETCLGYLDAGASENSISFNFTGAEILNQYFGGGFVEIIYETSQVVPDQESTKREYLPGIDGVPNYYGSFYVPGTLTGINASLHFRNNFTSYFFVGNKTMLYDEGQYEEQTEFVSSNDFAVNFSFEGELSSRTVPIRFQVFANDTGQTGYADVVLITDVSGSMAWQMGSDSYGTSRECDNAQLYDSDTQRISVAKCIDADFVEAIMEGVGNQVALVSFSSSVMNYTSFTDDVEYLESVISGYSANGGTCIACAINKAYDLLEEYSNENRTQYIIVMSDGVANYRGSEECVRYYDLDYDDGKYFASEDYGYFARFDAGDYEAYSAGTSTDFYTVSGYGADGAWAAGYSGRFGEFDGNSFDYVQDIGSYYFYGISMYSSSFGFAVGTAGKIYRYNGFSWSQSADTGQEEWRGVDVWSPTLALAVGRSTSDDRVADWDGSSWSYYEPSGFTSSIYDVKFLNSTRAIAAGYAGRVYEWTSAGGWANFADTGGQTWYDVSPINESAFALLSSTGEIRVWDGASWFGLSSPVSTGEGLAFKNSTEGFVAGTNELHYWDGSIWAVKMNREMGIASTGVSCGDSDSCWSSFSSNWAARNANWSSCRAHYDLNATVYAVGFGPVASCSLADETLNAVADCGNGSYFASSDASELAEFYTSLARIIVEESNSSQLLNVSAGDFNATLYPDSYIEYSFIPDERDYVYGDLSVTIENPPFPSCNGSVFIPSEISVDEAKITSYSADKWTDLVLVQGSQVFNLSEYAMDYENLGDPFVVQFNASFVDSGESNEFSVQTGTAYGNASAECSSDNRLIYKGRLRAQVNYSSIFPECYSRNATVYYDLDYDGVSDGAINVSIGNSQLESAGDEYVTPEYFDTNNNGVDNALQRLLDALNFMNDNPSSPSGAIDNPIDLKIGDSVNLTVMVGQGVPFMWGPAEMAVIVWS